MMPTSAELYAELDATVRGLREAIREYQALVATAAWSEDMCAEADALLEYMRRGRAAVAELEEELGLDPGSVELPAGPV